jgi:iron complex transport system ATP-binding protein
MEQLKYAIEVSNLTFAYNGSLVLDRVNINIESGKLTFVLGRNGSGKSTLLKIMAGLIHNQGGVVEILGNDISRITYSERSRLTGYLGQQHKAVFPFSVEDVILTGRAGHIKFFPGEADKIATERAMERVGILHLRDRNYTELSGGEQQLVMIARLLAQDSRILLLDEPTTYLDFSNQSHLLNLLKQLVSEGLTIIAVMHDPNMAFIFGDDFLFVKDRKVIRSKESLPAWDTEFLISIYNSDLEAIPYNDRAIIVPSVN